ncbi:site-specific integrase [Pseudomonas sp. BN606]|jgi:integrase|uniref:site-specific integrase n=1 Tax=Pseudomonas sp. BN606 TaxID=2567894 RepID=UPI00245530A4|nr:site-specific integrase [Pseudomonas sp. BN606]MDH4651709.1 site-specific integrase [Pseudomonas sp. BN606]
MAKHLEKQGSTYHVRLAIPKDVQADFGGRRILSKSLKTGDKYQALADSHAILAQWKAEIEMFRAARQLPEGWQEGVVATATAIGQLRQQGKLEAIGEAAPPLPPVDPAVLAKMEADGVPAMLEKLVAIRAPAGVAGRLKTQDDLARIALTLAEHQVKAKHTLSADQSAELTELINNPSSYKPKSPLTSARLEAFRVFGEKQGLSKKSLDIQGSKLAVLSAYLNTEGSPLSFDTVATWLDTLTVQPKTKKQYVWAGSKFWQWAMKYDARWREDYKGKPNPFEDHTMPVLRGKAAADAKRKAFAAEQLAGLYAAAKEGKNVHLPDLIALGAYTGARIEELCQLRVEDIITVEGIPALSIKDSKTEAGVRETPIHADIAELVARLAADSKDGYLLPSSGGNKYGVRSDPYSKAFGRLKTALQYGRQHVFHSIRYTVITCLQRADVPGVTIASIVGHETGTVTFDVYAQGPSMKQKAVALAKLPTALLQLATHAHPSQDTA